MRLLFVHADRFAFAVRAEDGGEGGETDDCVTAFVTVEAGDRADPDAAVANAADELRAAADRLNARTVALYPTEHLGGDPADADLAETVLRDLDAAVADEFEVLRAPVGRHVAFEVASKGHPFAEFSRRVTTERPAAHADSEWRLLFPDGRTLDPADAAAEVDDGTCALVAAEVEGDAPPAGDAVRTDRLRESGLADGAPGERRWYPRGTVVRDALAAYAADRAVEHGATRVETPDCDPFALADDRERDRPLRLFETGGAGAFGAMHTAAQDLDEARGEFRAQARLALRTGADLGLDYRPVVRATRECYEARESWVGSLVADLGSPALVELLPDRPGNPPVAVEFAAVDGDGPVRAAAVELHAAETPPVVRCSLLEERAVDAMVAAAAARDPPRLPTWLAPTQVRFVPVEASHVERCDALAADLETAGVRADVDDREATVGERIARAEDEWVPYYAVVGDRERDGGPLAVNVRAGGEERAMTPDELRETVLEAVGEMPTRRRTFPRRVSRQLQFGT